MASSSSLSFSLLSTLLLSLILFSVSPSTANKAFIEQNCRGNLYEEFCLSSLVNDQAALACDDDVQCIANVAMKHAIQNSTATQQKAQDMLNKVRPPPRADWVAPLNTCVKIYGSLTKFLQGVSQQITSNPNVEPDTDDEPTTEKCGQGFPGGNDASPMKEWDRLLSITVEMAIQLCGLI